MEENSVFEIILENKSHDIRYGFEINISKSEVVDEWMFAKLEGSTRESSIFQRYDKRVSKRFPKLLRESLLELNSSMTIVNYLNKMRIEDSVFDSFFRC